MYYAKLVKLGLSMGDNHELSAGRYRHIYAALYPVTIHYYNKMDIHKANHGYPCGC